MLCVKAIWDDWTWLDFFQKKSHIIPAKDNNVTAHGIVTIINYTQDSVRDVGYVCEQNKKLQMKSCIHNLPYIANIFNKYLWSLWEQIYLEKPFPHYQTH